MKTRNATHDAACYDSCGYQHGDPPLFPTSPLLDANALYRGFRRAQKGSAWKEPVQKFEMNFLSNIAAQQRAIYERKYTRGPCINFVLNERGKTRVITGEHIADRALKHVL